MLNERTARMVYESETDEARLDVEGAGVPGAYAGQGAQLLLDANGALVGVDLGGEGLARTVVMLGPHEAVAATREATVEVARDARGGPSRVRIAGARGKIRV